MKLLPIGSGSQLLQISVCITIKLYGVLRPINTIYHAVQLLVKVRRFFYVILVKQSSIPTIVPFSSFYNIFLHNIRQNILYVHLTIKCYNNLILLNLNQSVLWVDFFYVSQCHLFVYLYADMFHNLSHSFEVSLNRFSFLKVHHSVY
jgi:hypothetical protein